MIPSSFDHTAPGSIDDAIRALSGGADDAKVLAGGQSLLPVLKLRMADPGLLVDLGSVDGLRGVRDAGDEIVVGAMTTHHDVAHDPLVREHSGVLAQAAGSVADPQIRYRGTIGGSLAHADPAGDIGPAVLALGATLDVAGPGGVRTIPATDFFEDYFTTALADDEILTAVRVPKHTGWGMRYEKFTQTAQSWAVVAVAAAVRVESGVVTEARLGLSNMGSTPLRAGATEAALAGQPCDEAALHRAAERVGEGTRPPDDPAGTPEYRRHLAGVLAGRAVAAAAGLG